MKFSLSQKIKRFKNYHFFQRFVVFLVKKTAEIFKLDLVSIAYSTIGILNYRNEFDSGEYYLASKWLKQFIETQAIDRPCLFDVGANVGNYSRMLFSLHPNASIFSFEPNPATFQNLQSLSQTNPNIRIYNTALGTDVGTNEFYFRQDNAKSGEATFFKDVWIEVHGFSDIKNCKVQVNTLDNFCSENHISRIDFLKIDTEGYEMKVLQGAENLLKTGKISAIQFEFNNMNIYSRVFLRDFFEILRDFNIYRLLPKSLLSIQYRSKHEIFQFQNFLAVRKDLDSLRS